MEFDFLKLLVIILGISALVVFILRRLKISSIVGFLIAGIIVGPHGFQLIKGLHNVELLAEIGIILLMFTIGLEFSLKNLLKLRHAVFGGGLLQISITTGITVFLSYLFFRQDLSTSVFYGFLVSLSSTAIVMKILQDRAELYTSYSRMSLGMLIFQDLAVVPFMLLVPIFAGTGGGISDITYIMLKAFIIIGAVLMSAKWGVPIILHQVVSTKSRELFIITIVLLCLATALLTSRFGLSIALGAFLAGIVISDSEYSAQAISDMLPFKEIFTGIFFISIGMLMNAGLLRKNLVIVSGVVLLILLIKIIAVTVSASVSGQSLRSSIHTGFYLSQIGEFSFILALAGKNYGLITDNIYQIFLSASVSTMIITPLMVLAAPPVALWLGSRQSYRRFERMHRRTTDSETGIKRTGHVIIIGFGINGQHLARVLKESGIAYVILDLNNNTVRRMKRNGEPVYYGDGTSNEILHKLGIETAKVLVVAISDATATRRTVQIARKDNPCLYIIVRTRYVAEVEDLITLGANEVIPEEFETSVEIFSRVLDHYNTPGNVIKEYIDIVREDSYRVLRGIGLPGKAFSEYHDLLRGMETEAYLIKDTSGVAERSLKELNLRVETGATIIAIKRGESVHQNPSSGFVLKHRDVLLFIGKKEDLNSAVRYLDSSGNN
ncbi:MAG: cation:proton antiporter [Nitrospira sp.]|nr:cation:proton antiporter [Nitrospira sp.]